MTIARSILACLAAATVCTLASAQNLKLRPGLWEVHGTMKTSSGQMEAAMAQMQQQLARMSPEQRKQMEQMMGGSIPSPNGGQTTRICMTQADVDKDHVEMRKGCTQDVTRVDGKTLKLKFQCAAQGNEPASSGEGTTHIESPTAYSGTYQMQTTANGKSEQMHLTQTGQWLGSDCGTVKPLGRH